MVVVLLFFFFIFICHFVFQEKSVWELLFVKTFYFWSLFSSLGLGNQSPHLIYFTFFSFLLSYPFVAVLWDLKIINDFHCLILFFLFCKIVGLVVLRMTFFYLKLIFSPSKQILFHPFFVKKRSFWVYIMNYPILCTH